ncbi:MAG TPA: M48 family metallopeptidase [Burkholderiaceae bacterium]|nr:M48 family metallopeptidase [Burkholderiaceae bacterium]
MDFFHHQETARRSTRHLVVLFVIAVLTIIIAVNFAATAIYFGFLMPSGTSRVAGALPAGFYFFNTCVVLGLIGGGTAYKLTALSAGGASVANLVDAREVDMTTGDLLDRRLINVVEEMAIASGVPTPRVYVMDNEPAINAFAAGQSINDAVIVVTRGALTRLSRDELQGVIAHEFSHVLNGDMRLNLRLIGVLHGLLIVALAGRLLLEVGGRSRGGSSRSGNGMAILFFAGVALWLLGYIGVFFGRLIKSAVSRQREFLADASAVQFTRNPDGIGGALRKIGGLTETTGLGTRIDHPQAEALSHLFLGAARPTFVRGLFATHPSLEERVKRIYGRKQAFLPAPENALALAMAGEDAAAPRQVRQLSELNALSPVAGLVAAAAAGAAAQGEIAAAVGTVAPPASREFALDESQRATVDTLRGAASDAIHAQVIVFALLVDKASDLRRQQCELIAEAYGTEASQLAEHYHGLIQQLPPGARQPLLDLAMPALRKLPGPARQRVLKLAHMLIVADGRVSIREFLLFTILNRRLGPDATKAVPVRYRSVSELPRDAALVLSLIAVVRLPKRPEHAFNAGALLLSNMNVEFVGAEAIQLDQVSAALDRLNQLAPLAKPQLIKAATATAFVDSETNWRAASTLRMICASLDAPLPPQIVPMEAAAAA